MCNCGVSNKQSKKISSLYDSPIITVGSVEGKVIKFGGNTYMFSATLPNKHPSKLVAELVETNILKGIYFYKAEEEQVFQDTYGLTKEDYA
jgi:hypothetical protein